MMSGKLPKVSVIGGERVIKCKFKPTSSCAIHDNTNDDLELSKMINMSNGFDLDESDLMLNKSLNIMIQPLTQRSYKKEPFV